MSSDLFKVIAKSVDGLTASLDVRIVHPDVDEVPADASFALMILADGANANDPLGREVAVDDLLDKGWVKKFSRGFVSAVRAGVVKNRRARLDVTVTHPAWLAHVKAGSRWDSRAFPVVDRYDPHAPIAPSATATAASPSTDDLFVWVPSLCFAIPGPSKQALMLMPAYSASAYKPGEAISDGRDWFGKPVFQRPDRVGTLASGGRSDVGDDSISIFHLGRGISGCGSFAAKYAATTLATLVPRGGRLGTKLSYAKDILPLARVSVFSVKKSGAILELGLSIPPDGRALYIESETDAFEVLYRPLHQDAYRLPKKAVPAKGHLGQTSTGGLFLESKLTQSLAADLTERGLEGPDMVKAVCSELAKKYVASFSVSGPPAHDVPDLDRATLAEAKRLLEKPWPEATLRIVATDPRWIAHLTSTSFDSVPDLFGVFPLDPPTEPKPKSVPATSRAYDARAVLWFKDGSSDKIWIAERTGATLKTRWGKRVYRRPLPEKIDELATPEAAAHAYDKAVAKKLKERYQPAQSSKEASDLVWKRIGLLVDDSSGQILIKRIDSTHALVKKTFRVGDELTNVADLSAGITNTVAGDGRVGVLEEVALAITGKRKGTDFELDYVSGSRGFSSGVRIKLR